MNIAGSWRIGGCLDILLLFGGIGRRNTGWDHLYEIVLAFFWGKYSILGIDTFLYYRLFLVLLSSFSFWKRPWSNCYASTAI